MFAIERQKVIKNMILEQGQVEVNTLSQILNVSEVTIRKDLDKLQKDLVLIRTHGGAILQEDKKENLEIFSETDDELGVIGSMLIEDGDTIMLLNGEISRNIAKKLEDKKNLTIITNDLILAQSIIIQNNSKVILIGGEMDFVDFALYGPIAINNVQEFFVNKSFIEIDGLSEELEITCKNPNKAMLIKACLNNCNEKIFMFKSKNYKNKSLYKIGNMEIATKVLSTVDISDELKDKLFSMDIKIYTPVNILERRYNL